MEGLHAHAIGLLSRTHVQQLTPRPLSCHRLGFDEVACALPLAFSIDELGLNGIYVRFGLY